jgi:hypothetical protein
MPVLGLAFFSVVWGETEIVMCGKVVNGIVTGNANRSDVKYINSRKSIDAVPFLCSIDLFLALIAKDLCAHS